MVGCVHYGFIVIWGMAPVDVGRIDVDFAGVSHRAKIHRRHIPRRQYRQRFFIRMNQGGSLTLSGFSNPTAHDDDDDDNVSVNCLDCFCNHLLLLFPSCLCLCTHSIITPSSGNRSGLFPTKRNADKAQPRRRNGSGGSSSLFHGCLLVCVEQILCVCVCV